MNVKETPAPLRDKSPLWHRAIERYLEELADNDDYASISEISSLDDLADYARTLEPFLPREPDTLSSIRRLKPALKFVDDFSAVLALYFGADVKLTACVWGSIRLMITLASSAGDTLKDVLDMLEELSLTLPRFKHYEDNLHLHRSLENALVDVYTEVICFYARCIYFFRTHPHVLLRRNAWDEFRNDFARTQRRIKRLSSVVESEAEAARLKDDRARYGEVLELMQTLRSTKVFSDDASNTCHYIPCDMNPRFWGREDALQAIDKALEPGKKPRFLRTFALYGIGGVGKTQIALQYARRHFHDYPVIMWVAADNVISMGQSFLGIARSLGLVRGGENIEDPVTATLRVKNWLIESSSPWLVVFDNADKIDLLRHVWPANGQGSIVLTTRDSSAAGGLGSDGFQVQPFDNQTGSEVLLRLVGLDPSVSANQEKALDITQALGGLPLALNQIGGFIVQRRLPLQDFLPLYERNAAKIDARKTGLGSYEHTLSTVWEMSITKLSGDARSLLNILPYFQPDAITEDILSSGSAFVDDPGFVFLGDEMDLGDAGEVLLKCGLIDKNAETAAIAVHRLIQAAIARAQSNEERNKYFDVVTRLLTWGFPDTWSSDVGHQFQTWSRCEKCLPHVIYLIGRRKKYNIAVGDTQLYGELFLRCSWYLYEREHYDLAKEMANAAVEAFQDKTTLAYASAVDLAGLVDLDLCHPEEAMVRFDAALSTRKSLLGEGDALVASSLNNIALAYTEMGQLDKAYDTHSLAIRIRLDLDSDRIGNSYSNMSSLLLRMGKPDEAEEMLKRCPSLKDFTDDTFLQTGNPRFSGDMVLLSRIRRMQGRMDDALRLASKALAFRQKMLGNRLKTCDSLYDVASLMRAKGNTASACEILTQLADIAGSIPEGKGQLARAYYQLAVLAKEMGREHDAEKYRDLAEKGRRELKPELRAAPFDEASFMKLCLWMLW